MNENGRGVVNGNVPGTSALRSQGKATMPGHVAVHLKNGRHFPAVIIIRHGASLARVIEDLILILEVSRPEAWTDTILYLPL